jgi:hypothetical protein
VLQIQLHANTPQAAVVATNCIVHTTVSGMAAQPVSTAAAVVLVDASVMLSSTHFWIAAIAVLLPLPLLCWS